MTKSGDNKPVKNEGVLSSQQPVKDECALPPFFC